VLANAGWWLVDKETWKVQELKASKLHFRNSKKISGCEIEDPEWSIWYEKVR